MFLMVTWAWNAPGHAFMTWYVARQVVGGGGGGSVTWMAVEYAEALPTASRARTAKLYMPAARPLRVSVFDVVERVVTVPASVCCTSYPTTPTLSLERPQFSISESAVTLNAPRPVGTVGGEVSTPFVVVTVTVPLSPDSLPAASRPRIAKTYVVLGVNPVRRNELGQNR